MFSFSLSVANPYVVILNEEPYFSSGRGGLNQPFSLFILFWETRSSMSWLFLNPHLVKQQLRSSSAEDQYCFMKYPAQLNFTCLIQTSGTVRYFCRKKVFIICWGKTCISVSNDGNPNQLPAGIVFSWLFVFAGNKDFY